MGDAVPAISAKAIEVIQNSDYQNPLVLVKALNIPSRKVREGLFRVLETLNIKALDVYRFARTQLKKAYSCLMEREALKVFSESLERDLLMDHLLQEEKTRIDNVLRVLSIQDASGRTRLIWRGLSSSDARQRANGVEALTHVANRALTTILIPLVEELPLEEKLKAGRKTFAFPELREKPSLIAHLIAKGDWVTSLLALSLAAKDGYEGLDPKVLASLAASENPWLSKAALRRLDASHQDRCLTPADPTDDMDPVLRMLQAQKVGIFQGLAVGELAAIGVMCKVVSYGADQVVIREGEPGDTLYLIIDGDVSVTKGEGIGTCNEITVMTVGDYFGEMALIDEAPRSATVKTKTKARFMVLSKEDFARIVHEHPPIGLNICKTLSHRIRELLTKLGQQEKMGRPLPDR